MEKSSAQASLIERRRVLLADVLRDAEFCRGDIRSMTLASGGNSRETWIVEFVDHDKAGKLVFRCDPDDWIRPAEMANEIRGLRLANAVGIPAPRLLLSSEDREADRPFVLTDYVAGETIPRRIMRENRFGEARRRFARQTANILAQLHTAGAHSGDWQCRDPIADLTAHRDRVDYPSPALEGAFHWLVANHPGRPATPTPVHGDFRLGNFMFDEGGITAVLDWETCHLCDPDEDIGWLCSPAWRYGGALTVGGLGASDEFYAVYEKAAGREVDRERVLWWTIYGLVRWGYACATPPASTKSGDRMEQAAVARQITRQEYFVLKELEVLVGR